MKYTSQTGTIIIGSEQERSTAPALRVESNTPLGFKIVDQSKLSIKPADGQVREELTKEEEDRFYKKAFETGLI